MGDVLGLCEVCWCIPALTLILVGDVVTDGASRRETFVFTALPPRAALVSVFPRESVVPFPSPSSCSPQQPLSHWLLFPKSGEIDCFYCYF